MKYSYENEKLTALMAAVKAVVICPSSYVRASSSALAHYIDELGQYIENEPGTASENNLIRAVQTYLNEQLVLAKRLENK